MFTALQRKARHFIRDPVLRHWLYGAAFGRIRRPKSFVAGRPAYLGDASVPPDAAPSGAATDRLASLSAVTPHAPLTLTLPGETVTLAAGEPGTLFDRTYADTETLLAVHRFAWLPLAGSGVDPAWVDALWRAWADSHADPDNSWAWHPYTTAERAINILDFAARHGLPGDRDRTLALLARHAPAIAGKLEYFGDHYTSNHLSNNGRGLYLLGLALGIDAATDLGARLLLAEAGRIFRPSGVLREGSTHYHLLLTRNYVTAWLAARRHGRAEADTLAAITQRALEFIPHLVLPGGLPLIGDISPDCPPDFLSGLLPDGGGEGWYALLSDEDREALEQLRARCRPPSPDRAAADGWLRFGTGAWSCLWHVAPDGWPPMPGHAHQDMGSFELHYGDRPLFIDTGRGAYGEDGEAGFYAGAAAHNTLVIDGHAPYPTNRPYYDADFRRGVAPPPAITRSRDSVSVAHGGYRRLKGVGEVARSVSFTPSSVTITDRVEGSGSHRLTRRLHTTLPVRAEGNDAVIDGPGRGIRFQADAPVTVEQGKRWTAYGVAEPASVIEMTTSAELPTRLSITVTIE